MVGSRPNPAISVDMEPAGGQDPATSVGEQGYREKEDDEGRRKEREKKAKWHMGPLPHHAKKR